MISRRVGIVLVISATVASALGWGITANRARQAEHQIESGFAAARAGRLAQAEAALQTGRAQLPDDRNVLLLAARLARQREDYAAAQEHLDKYERHAGRTRAGLLEAALGAAQRGELARHVEEFLRDELKKNNEDAPLIWEALAKGYVQNRRLDEALACVEDLLHECPEHVAGLMLRGTLWESFREKPDALRDYRRAVALDPENGAAQLRLALALAQTGQAQEAVPHLERLRRLRPDHPPLLVELAKCRRELGELATAQALLDDLVLCHTSNDGSQEPRTK